MNNQFTKSNPATSQISIFSGFGYQILWILLVTGPLFFGFQFKKSGEFGLAQAKEIRIKKSEIVRLFSLKANETTQIHLQKEGTRDIPVKILVINHVNPGSTSGAIAARLTIDDVGSRLLINRKEKKQVLVYWLAILPDKGDQAYKLTQETKEEFVLVQVSKNEIVTE